MALAIRAALCVSVMMAPPVLAASPAGVQPTTVVRPKGGATQDFGDAPAPYRTLHAEGGAEHPAAGPRLGSLRDAELDGLPSAQADGDDLDGSDDEDGVTEQSASVGGFGAFTVNLQNGPGRLDAWVDFNGDGSWSGGDEHVFIDKALASGDNTLNFQVPATAIDGFVMARFRVSTAGSLGPNGVALDGEVEDHRISVSRPTASNGQLIDSGQSLDVGDGTFETRLVDVDGDGDLDLITVSTGSSPAAKTNRVYLNDGAGGFTDSGQTLGSNSTYGLAVGDVDGDGDIDFIAGNAGQRTLLYRNDGHGVFSVDAPTMFPSLYVYPVELADLDSDGDLDLIVGVLNNPNRIYLNDGTGQFTDTGQLLGDYQTLTLSAGDIDGDGDIDFYEGTGQSNTKNRFWLNDGSGTFTVGQLLSTGRTQGSALGDIDGDGDLDLIEGRASGTFVRLNDGSGTFGGATGLTSDDVHAIELVDMDGDGDLDIVEGNYFQGNRVLLNDGSGAFTDTGQSLGAEATYALATGDVDGDGDLDVVEGNYLQPNRVWFNTELDFGDAPAPYRTLISAGGAAHPALGPRLGSLRDAELDGLPSAQADGDDLDGSDDEDGVTEQSASVGGFGAFTVNLQNGPGRLDAWVDFNGDGSWSGGDEHVFIDKALASGDNTLNFQVPATAIDGFVMARFRVSTAGSLGPNGVALDGEVEDHRISVSRPTASNGQLIDSGQSLDVGDGTFETRLVDVDGDGDLDLITVSTGSSPAAKTNRVYLNDGAGGFTDSGQTLGSNSTYGLAVGDVDGDGDIDFIAGNAGQRTLLYRNDGHGVFSVDAPTMFPSLYVYPVELADLDSDGDLDLIVGVLNNPNRIYLNDGTGQFTDTGQLLGDYQTLTLSAGDIDGDGDIDFYEGTGQSNTKNRFWLNDGSGTFTVGQLLSTDRTQGSALGDIDGDGDLDLIEGRASGTFVRLNDGSGTFGGATGLTSDDVQAIELVDMDGDGDLDIVEGNYFQGNRVLLNDGSGAFTDTGQSLGAEATYALATGDVDGDGDLDVVEGNYRQPNRVWFNGTNPVQISVSSSTGSEADTSDITVTVTSLQSVGSDQTVDLGVTGTGITGSDYSLGAVQLTIPAGSQGASTTFSVLDDSLHEGDETAVLSITAVSSELVVGTPDSQSIVIVDNDPVPAVQSMSFSAATLAETGLPISLDLVLDRASAFDECVDVGFAGTATLATDYTVADDDPDVTGIQACTATGGTTAQLAVTPIDDSTYEGDESITASSGAGSAATTLTDAEDLPTVTALAFDPTSASENGGTSNLTATQSNPALQRLCYDLQVSGSATFGVDYLLADADPAPGLQVCIDANQLQGSLPLQGVDDNLFEGNETAQLSHGGFSGTLTLIDDENLPQIVSFGFDQPELAENGGFASLRMLLDHPWQAPQCIDVSYSGTATRDLDYTSEDQSAGLPGVQLCLDGGSTSGDLMLIGIDDTELEGFESIQASITSPESASSTIRIADDEDLIFRDNFELPPPPPPPGP